MSRLVLVQQLIPGVTKFGPEITWQIVGVYKDFRNGDWNEDRPEIDVPFWQSPWPQAQIAVRSAGDLETLAKDIEGVVHSVDPQLPLGLVRTMKAK